MGELVLSWDEGIDLAVFVEEHAPDPVGDTQSRDVVHGHLPDSGEHDQQFHHDRVAHARQLVRQLSVFEAVICKIKKGKVADIAVELDLRLAEEDFGDAVQGVFRVLVAEGVNLD